MTLVSNVAMSNSLAKTDCPCISELPTRTPWELTTWQVEKIEFVAVQTIGSRIISHLSVTTGHKCFNTLFEQ